jgi:zinc protease
MALSSPHFDKDDLERIRSQIMSDLRRETSSPSSLAGRKLLELAFGNHPYGHQATGTLDSVPSITVDDLKAYTRRIIARNTLKVAVVGDVDPGTLGKLLDLTFGGLPAKADLIPVPDIVAAKPPQRAFIPLDVPQTVISFGSPGVTRNDPDFMAAYVVNQVLGGSGPSSRLYREVREKRGLAYSVYGALAWMQHSALFIGNTAACDRAGSAPNRRGRPHPGGAGPGKILSEGLADAAARHVREARPGAPAVSARQNADRLHREAQRHDRRRDAG